MRGALLAHRHARAGSFSPLPGKFTAPGATAGDGSFYDPWSFAQALALATPGSTVWMRGGDYDSAASGGFSQTAVGSSGGRIVYRSFPGERARIRYTGADFKTAAAITTVGDYVDLRDVEICFSPGTWPQRSFETDQGSSHRAALQMNGLTNRIINAYVHDTGLGVASFAGTHGSDTYGTLLVNVGLAESSTAGRHHGPGTYQAHDDATGLRKRIRHCISAYGFENGFKTAGSGAQICDFDIEQNIIHRPGSHVELDSGPSGGGSVWELYSGAFMDSVNFHGQVIYAPLVAGSTAVNFLAIQDFYVPFGTLSVMDMWALVDAGGFADQYGWDGGLTWRNNTLSMDFNAGSSIFYLQPLVWQASRVYAVGVVVYNPGDSLTYRCSTAHTATTTFDPTKWTLFDYAAKYDFADNAWFGNSHIGSPFIVPVSQRVPYATFASFVGEATSTYDPLTFTPPDVVKVFPNEFEKGRANIAIGNCRARASSVTVDLSTVTGLVDGDQIWVWSAVNVEQGPILATRWNAATGLAVPMTVAAVGPPLAPYGSSGDVPGYVPPSTLPDFGSFIVRKVPDPPGYGVPPTYDL